MGHHEEEEWDLVQCVGHSPLIFHPPQIHVLLCSVPWGPWKWLHPLLPGRGFPGGTSGKEPICQCRRHKREELDPWMRKIPWRRTWQSTPLFLPGKSKGGWPATAHEITKSQTWLKQLSTNALLPDTQQEPVNGAVWKAAREQRCQGRSCCISGMSLPGPSSPKQPSPSPGNTVPCLLNPLRVDFWSPKVFTIPAVGSPDTSASLCAPLTSCQHPWEQPLCQSLVWTLWDGSCQDSNWGTQCVQHKYGG